MSQDYYRVIAGKKYDKKMIDIADEAVAGRGDGRISLEDAQLLIASVKDANKYTDIEKATMRYIRDQYRFTPASDHWFRTEIRKWAATKSRGKRHEEMPETLAAPAAPEIPAGAAMEAGNIPSPRPLRPEPEIPPPSKASSPPPGSWRPPAGQESAKRRRFWTTAAIVGLMALSFGVFGYWMNRPPPPGIAGNTPAEEAAGGTARSGVEAGSQSPPTRPDTSASREAEPPTQGPETPIVDTKPVAPTLAPTVESSRTPEGSPPAGSPLASLPAEGTRPAATAETSRAEAGMEDQGSGASGIVDGGVDRGTYRVRSGDTLWSISGARYGDAMLWPYLYHENRQRLPDPNLIPPGMKIVLPALEGSASNLSIRDRELTAQGYVDAYRAYRRLGRKWARPYLTEAGRWDPAILEKVKDNGS